jgi:hypothetical protein
MAMAFMRLRVFNGVCLVASTGILVLNLISGKYGVMAWDSAREQTDKVYEATGIIISNAKPASIQKFGQAEFKRAYKLLMTKGADRREIEAHLGIGQQQPESNKVRYRTNTGRSLEANYGEDGGLQQWQWSDEGKPKLPGGSI